MRRQSWIVLGLAIFFGLVAVYLVNTFLTSNAPLAEAGRPQAFRTTRVAVAALPLEFGTRLNGQNVRFVDWPADSVPEGSFISATDLMPAGTERVALRAIARGEPILRSRISGDGGRATLSALLPPDMRAVAIRISDVAGVAGFALPGDRVDVILTREVGEERVVSVLLNNVRLIAVDQDANESSERPSVARTATLEVGQEDAQMLALGGAVGQLSLALRSVRAPQDMVSYDNPIRSGDLAGGNFAPAPALATSAPSAAPSGPQQQILRRAAVPPRRGSSVEVVRGTASREYEVGRYGGL
jgi:pilus assembly protein CpaB